MPYLANAYIFLDSYEACLFGKALATLENGLLSCARASYAFQKPNQPLLYRTTSNPNHCHMFIAIHAILRPYTHNFYSWF